MSRGKNKRLAVRRGRGAWEGGANKVPNLTLPPPTGPQKTSQISTSPQIASLVSPLQVVGPTHRGRMKNSFACGVGG